MTDAMTNTAPAPATADAQTTRRYPEFKEMVTALIALAIVATTIGLLWWGFIKGLDDNQKYIIGIALSLAGTVTGYYFGRVPAEKRAETAERSEDKAKAGKAKSDAMVADTTETLARVLSGGGDDGDGPQPQGVRLQASLSNNARRELEALHRRLR